MDLKSQETAQASSVQYLKSSVGKWDDVHFQNPSDSKPCWLEDVFTQGFQ